MQTSAQALIDAHRQAGDVIDVAGLPTFVRTEGSGQAVVLVHGVPVSAWVWRNVLPELAARGFTAIAPDLPGLGLSSRPRDFDYSWTGLGRHLARTLDTLGLDDVHLVVHDIGGPVGFEVAATMPERVAALTVLNTIAEPRGFVKPPPMRPFQYPVLGEAWLGGMSKPVFRALMHRVGLAPGTSVTDAEIDVHHTLLRQDDGGRAFLRIMRSFETTAEKSALYGGVLAHERPRQLLWGVLDPALKLRTAGRVAEARMGTEIQELPGRHFVQEDCARQIAERVATLAR